MRRKRDSWSLVGGGRGNGGRGGVGEWMGMGGWGGEELDQVRCELRNQVQEREVVQMTERVEECGERES